MPTTRSTARYDRTTHATPHARVYTNTRTRAPLCVCHVCAMCQVFPVVAHDSIPCLLFLKDWSATINEQECHIKKSHLMTLRGHLTRFPLDFLKHEDLGKPPAPVCRVVSRVS